MPGRRKYAQLLTERPRETIDAASQITPANSLLSWRVAETHVDDLRRAADPSMLARGAKDLSLRSVENLVVPITIRSARPADASALANLAERDSAEVPSLPVLIAEANDELRAAMSLYDGAAIA